MYVYSWQTDVDLAALAAGWYRLHTEKAPAVIPGRHLQDLTSSWQALQNDLDKLLRLEDTRTSNDALMHCLENLQLKLCVFEGHAEEIFFWNKLCRFEGRASTIVALLKSMTEQLHDLEHRGQEQSDRFAIDRVQNHVCKSERKLWTRLNEVEELTSDDEILQYQGPGGVEPTKNYSHSWDVPKEVFPGETGPGYRRPSPILPCGDAWSNEDITSTQPGAGLPHRSSSRVEHYSEPINRPPKSNGKSAVNDRSAFEVQDSTASSSLRSDKRPAQEQRKFRAHGPKDFGSSPTTSPKDSRASSGPQSGLE